MLKGRRRIYTDHAVCDSATVCDIVIKSLPVHSANASEIKYLWKYYKGESQPIHFRTKEVRPEICNRIVENHAQECVNFKIGYQLSEPVQYVSRAGDEDESRSEQIKLLNDLMFAEDKASSDHDLFEWECICGLGYRICLPDDSWDYEEGTAPFKMHVLDPDKAFVVYSSDYEHRPVCGVCISEDSMGNKTYTVYSEKKCFVVAGGAIISEKPHVLGSIPIVEYDLNNALMGVFEPALPLLDAIDAIESNRLDGVEQTVQSLMKFINCDIDEDTFIGLLKLGAIKVSSIDGQKSDVEVMKNDLDQSQTQITKEDLYQSFVNIVGMPNRSMGRTSSDTGAAVLLRDGWTLAESHAKSYELQFKKSERMFLRVALKICRASDTERIDLRIRDIDLAFNRRNYDNILTKSQVLTTMLATDKIHPLLAFQSCGMFTDPDAAYLMSEAYFTANSEKTASDGSYEALTGIKERPSLAGQPEQ